MPARHPSSRAAATANAPSRYDKQRYRGRHLIENAFCRLKDFRRIHTRYDKLAANFLSAAALATAVAFWLVSESEPKRITQPARHAATQIVVVRTT